MAIQFYRKLGDPTVYQDEAMTQGIKDEAQLRSLGGIPDWGATAGQTNIRTLDNRSPVAGAETSLTFDRGTQPDSYGIFNNALMEMLRSAQKGLGTRQSQQAAIDLSNQQVQRGQSMATPGMNPSLQAGIRNADMNAITPSIQGANDQTQTMQERLSGFKDVLAQTERIGQTMADIQFQNQQQSLKMIQDAIDTYGSKAFDGVDEKELTVLEKSASLPSGYLSRKAKTLKEEEQINQQLLDQKKLAIDQQNANRLSGGGGGGGGSVPTGNNGQPVLIDDPNYMLSVLQQSKGGKAMDASSITSLSKSFNVLDQMNELSGYITGESTGPILGILRSNNPYDVKAQLIKAQLTAIVPNLARGVYGEVGVLTDNDVALYSRTLPNLSSTEDLRKAVLAMTVKTVQRSIENQLEVQAAGGRNVSGYENLYKKLQNKTDSLNKSLGIDKQTNSENIIIAPDGNQIEIIDTPDTEPAPSLNLGSGNKNILGLNTKNYYPWQSHQ